MKIINIEYPTTLEKVDRYDDNIDVFVKLEDGNTYNLVVTTPKNYYTYMEKEGVNYIPASPPDIIVKELTNEIITAAIKSYLDNQAFWLKVYYLCGLRSSTFNMENLDRDLQELKNNY